MPKSIWDKTEVPLEYGEEDVLAWLRSLPPDTMVHKDDGDVCRECTVARFLQEQLSDGSVAVAYSTATTDQNEDILYVLKPWFGRAIPLLDMISSARESGLTAGAAIDVLENMEEVKYV